MAGALKTPRTVPMTGIAHLACRQRVYCSKISITAEQTTRILEEVTAMERFEGKTALVSGASAGIGRATAVRLADEGATVVGLGRNTSGLDETRSLVSDPQRFHGLYCDARHDESIIQAVQQSLSVLGHIDVLVNNAGTTEFATVDRQEMDVVRDL